MNFIKHLLAHLKNIRFEYIKYCFFNVISTLVEAAGIISIYPLISLLTNENFFNNNSLILKFREITGENNFDTVFIYFALFVIVMFTLTSLMKLYILKYQAFFVHHYSYLYSRELLKTQLSKNFIWFLNQDHSHLIKDTIEETSILVGKIFLSSANLIISIISILIFVVILFYFTNFYFLLASLIAISPYLLISKYLSKKITFIGKTRFDNNQKRYETLSNIYQGIKEIKSRGLEKKFFDFFDNVTFSLSKAMRSIAFLAQSPRYILELFFIIIFIMTLIYINTYTEIESSVLISSISVIILSVLRLIPHLQLIYKNYSDLKFYAPTLYNMTVENFSIEDGENILDKNKINLNEEILEFNKYIEFKNVYFSYNKKEIYECLNIKFYKSKTIGITGPSGVGKTTLFNILMGLIKVDKGSILIDGYEINTFNNVSYKKLFGYIPQDCFLLNDTLKKNITLLGDFVDSPKNQTLFDRLVDVCELRDVLKNLKNKENTFIGDQGKLLSGGERQRVGIARALYLEPKILILDEATSAIDKDIEKKIMNSLKARQDLTKIIISHDQNLLGMCDEVYKVEEKKIVRT